MTRQEKRNMIRKAMKEKLDMVPQSSTPKATMDQVMKEINNLSNQIRQLDNNIFILVESLSNKGFLNWTDITDMQQLYTQREIGRRNKITELLSAEKSNAEKFDLMLDDESLPAYKKFNIHPVRELNISPFEVADFIKDKHPGLSDEEYLKIGSKWNINREHFLMKEEEHAK